jgi:hypothetical protein
MDKLVQTLGITGLSKSHGDGHVSSTSTSKSFGPFTFVAAALVLKVRATCRRPRARRDRRQR